MDDYKLTRLNMNMHKQRLIQSAICFIVLAVMLPSCKKEYTEQQVAITSDAAFLQTALVATPDTYWDSVFTRYGGGWTGGDGAFSLGLPDGRSLWLWGDSFLDTVYPDRTRPIQGFIHNQLVTTNRFGGDFTTYHKGTKESPLPYFAPSGVSNHYYWPASAFMNAQQTKIYVMLQRIRATGSGGIWGFEQAGTDIAVLDYPSLQQVGTRRFTSGNGIDWTPASLSENGYIYLYGVESTKYNKFIHVARTPANAPFQQVEYFDGAVWTTDTSASARIQGGVSQMFSVFNEGGRYYLVSQGNLLSPDIYIWDAPSPTGPFGNKRKLYTTPKVTRASFTYNATAHRELTDDGSLLIGYSTNTENVLQLFNNVDSYRPYFIRVTGWQ